MNSLKFQKFKEDHVTPDTKTRDRVANLKQCIRTTVDSRNRQEDSLDARNMKLLQSSESAADILLKFTAQGGQPKPIVRLPLSKPQPIVRLPLLQPPKSNHDGFDLNDGAYEVVTLLGHRPLEEQTSSADTASQDGSMSCCEDSASSFTTSSSGAVTIRTSACPHIASRPITSTFDFLADESPAAATIDLSSPTIVQSALGAIAATATATNSHKSILQRTTPNEMSHHQEEDAEADEVSAMKRMRKRGGRGKGRGNPKAGHAIDSEPSESSDTEAAFPNHPSLAVLLLQNAMLNWQNVCNILTDGISPQDREILHQITNLIGRLGMDTNANTSTCRSLSDNRAGDTATQYPSPTTRLEAMDGKDEGAKRTSLESSEDSFHIILENGTKGEKEQAGTAQEDEEERQSRLDRIATHLSMRRKEQPIGKDL
ncbi:MAG: hypothetical protein Q9170_007376 [Blastenia crenularia]